MNVYQKTYKPEFTKQLPVNFNKIKNMDLSQMPEVFHELFTTDWNWGNHSSMGYSLRIIMNDLHKEYINWCIWDAHDKNKPKKIDELQGFPKD
jgi:hypothetical protein